MDEEERGRRPTRNVKSEVFLAGTDASPWGKAIGSKKDNPYARPFGRLSKEELEQQITETELALAECQEMFATADSFKEPARGQKLQAEYDAIAKKLEQLEAEYFARET